MGNYYIYERISTDTQTLERQEGAIADYCKQNNISVPKENVFSDVITGKTIKRDGYQSLKQKLQKEDVLIMLDLDRLGRNWDIIKNEWKELTDRGVYIIVVNCPLINVLPNPDGEISIDKRLIQEMMFTLLCYVSQKEVEKISNRTKEALKAKKENGVVLGRPRVTDKAQQKEIKAMYRKGKSMDSIAEIVGVSRSSVRRVIRSA